MRTFFQWLTEFHGLDEKKYRTALGIYPSLYGAQELPPLAFTPKSATAALAFQTIHKDLLKNLLGAKPTKKKTTKKKKKKGRKKKKD